MCSGTNISVRNRIAAAGPSGSTDVSDVKLGDHNDTRLKLAWFRYFSCQAIAPLENRKMVLESLSNSVCPRPRG